MVLRTSGVRTHFEMDVSLPILTDARRQRLIRQVQVTATKSARQRIVKPIRPTIPESSATIQERAARRLARRQGLAPPAQRNNRPLRRSLSVRTPKRSKSRSYFTALRFQFNYYYYFQSPAWERFRLQIGEEAGAVIAEALEEAIREAL